MTLSIFAAFIVAKCLSSNVLSVAFMRISPDCLVVYLGVSIPSARQRERQFLCPVFQRTFQERIWNIKEDTEITRGGLQKRLNYHRAGDTETELC